jgi:hypothetical protein
LASILVASKFTIAIFDFVRELIYIIKSHPSMEFPLPARLRLVFS